MSGFYSRLSYSFGNEDWETEESALQVERGNRMLCITGSGDRSLHCLLTEAAEVVSVDANPIQNFLLQLKAAALRQLDYTSYLGFLGARTHQNRAGLLKELAPALTQETLEYWMTQAESIGRGIIYEGNIERRCRTLSTAIGLVRRRKVRRLFSANELDHQRQFVEEKWDNWAWRKAFDLAFLFMKQWFRDPGIYGYVSPRIAIGEYLSSRLGAYLRRGLASESLLLSLLLLGNVKPEGYPPYLQEKGYFQIREKLDRLSVQTSNVIQYLNNQPEASFDRFSFSDIASYMSQENFHHLLRAMVRTARPGARFCIRQFLSEHELPTELVSQLRRDKTLEMDLEARDRCFVYRYIVGSIDK